MPIKAKQAKVIRELYEYDHLFLGKETVAKITEPFGFVGKTYLAKADPPGTFKGLELHDKNGNPISEAEGQDADRLAEEIAQHLGVNYQPMFGRGSRLRECCARILEHLNRKEKVAA